MWPSNAEEVKRLYQHFSEKVLEHEIESPGRFVRLCNHPEILDFLNIDTSMLTTRSELQAKVRGLSCDDLDRVFDDCGIQHEFDREIKFFMLAEIAAKNDILQRKMEAHAANAPQCKDSELFKFLKYEGLNLMI